MRELVRSEIGGRVTEGEALWLRCRFGRQIGPRDCNISGVGGTATEEGGDGMEETTSALPSSDMDKRNRDDDCELGGGRIEPATKCGGHDDEKASALSSLLVRGILSNHW